MFAVKRPRAVVGGAMDLSPDLTVGRPICCTKTRRSVGFLMHAKLPGGRARHTVAPVIPHFQHHLILPAGYSSSFSVSTLCIVAVREIFTINLVPTQTSTLLRGQRHPNRSPINRPRNQPSKLFTLTNTDLACLSDAIIYGHHHHNLVSPPTPTNRPTKFPRNF